MPASNVHHASGASDTHDTEPVQARIPADLDAPDRILAGLTARQLIVLGIAGAPAFLAWQHLGGHLPWQVLTVMTILLGALALAAALATRDGISLDAWVLAAIRYRTASARTRERSQPHAGEGAGAGSDAGAPGPRPRGWPGWPGSPAGGVLPGPVVHVTDSGVLLLADGRHVALVASTTVTSALSTHADDAILAAGTAQWLNSLSGPVQILLRSRPTDLTATALELAGRAGSLAHPELARAALDHAEFLLDINEFEQPLRRSVIIACSDSGFTPLAGVATTLLARLRALLPGRPHRHDLHDLHGGSGVRAGHPGAQRSRAESLVLAHAWRTVEQVEAIGARATVLDIEAVHEVMAGIWDPFATYPPGTHGDPAYGAADPGPGQTGSGEDRRGSDHDDAFLDVVPEDEPDSDADADEGWYLGEGSLEEFTGGPDQDDPIAGPVAMGPVGETGPGGVLLGYRGPGPQAPEADRPDQPDLPGQQDWSDQQDWPDQQEQQSRTSPPTRAGGRERVTRHRATPRAGRS